MYLPDFDYYAPKTLSEACRLLAKFGNRSKVLAGGTDLLHKMKQEQAAPEIIVSLNKLDKLKQINYKKGLGVIIGARATHNEIAASPLLQEKYLSICEAAHGMANNQIRNTGTLGGNIANAVPSADLPPILIALGAQLTLVSSWGERQVLLEDFYLGVHKTILKFNEMITQVIIPDQSATGSTYLRFGLRRSGALAVASAAVAVTMDGPICRQVRIALGAAGPVPMRANQAEEILRNQEVDNDLLRQVGLVAGQECNPRSSIRGSAEYRRHLVGVLTKRALHQAIARGHC